jgi:hypothetical protein
VWLHADIRTVVICRDPKDEEKASSGKKGRYWWLGKPAIRKKCFPVEKVMFRRPLLNLVSFQIRDTVDEAVLRDDKKK